MSWLNRPINRECDACKWLFEIYTENQVEPPPCKACRWFICLTARSQDDYLEKLETTSLLCEFTPSEETVADWWNAIGRKTEDAARNWHYVRNGRLAA